MKFWVPSQDCKKKKRKERSKKTKRKIVGLLKAVSVMARASGFIYKMVMSRGLLSNMTV